MGRVLDPVVAARKRDGITAGSDAGTEGRAKIRLAAAAVWPQPAAAPHGQSLGNGEHGVLDRSSFTGSQQAKVTLAQLGSGAVGQRTIGRRIGRLVGIAAKVLSCAQTGSERRSSSTLRFARGSSTARDQKRSNAHSKRASSSCLLTKIVRAASRTLERSAMSIQVRLWTKSSVWAGETEIPFPAENAQNARLGR